MQAHRSVVTPGSPPTVTLPRVYNLAADLVDRQVEAGRGDHPAFVDDRGVLSYSGLLERSCRAGSALAALGLQPEQRVLLALLDTNDFPAVFLGAIRLGAVPVPLNTMLTEDDYVGLLDDSRAGLVVVSDALLPKLRAAAARVTPSPRLVVVGGAPGDLPRLDDLLAAASPTLAPAPTTPDDVAFWLYSSGSTGAPKGALHLQASPIRTSALYAQGVLGLRPDDVVYSAARLFFAYGLGNALIFPLSVGATAVLTAERPTAEVVGRVMRERRPTVFCGVPTLFASLLASEGFAASPALRVSTSAGEALPRHVGEAWRARVGSEILDGIGSTELLHIFLSNRPGDVRYGTSGRPVPGYALELRGDDGRPVADGQEGDLWVHGATACAGYWNQRERSLATFHGPWTRTGDRYVRDAEGYYTYSGRGDDMLKVGGIWVSPFEVESALAAHADVLEAAVVGHADPSGLIKPRAFVVLKDRARATPELEAALKLFVKERLAPYKHPRWVRFVDELPKTATGKIQRYKLRDPARA